MRRSGGSERARNDERAQSNPLGAALVIGMVLVGSAMIITLGASAVGDTQRTLDVDRAEKTLTQIDSRIAMVALGDSRRLNVGIAHETGSTYEVQDDAGWMNVTITDTTTGDTKTMFNETMGSIVFENGGDVIAYQGGGVWKGGENSSLMISPPEFYYRDATLTLPLVTVSGDASLTNKVKIERDGSTKQYYPDVARNSEWENPLDHGKVNVTVHSRHYRAWGSFWEVRTDGSVDYDHPKNTATVTLVVPAGRQEVTSAVVGTAHSGELKLAGSGSKTTRTDSYNSSIGTYSGTRTSTGTIRTAGDVTVKGNSKVEGTIRSGGFVTVKGAGEVVRDVFHADGTKITGTVGGTITQISAVDSHPPIDTYVERNYDNISASNDNGDTGVPITSNALDGGSQTLDPGTYHLNDLVLDGDTLTLNTGTSAEGITIGVRDHVTIRNGGKIRVEGTGKVRLLVNGASTNGDGKHFQIENSGGVVDVADDQNATQMWLYGRENFAGEIDGTSSDTYRFEGVVYAPGGTSGTSNFRIEKGDLYGGVVASIVEMDNGGSIHYDQALKTVRAVPPDESILRLTYLHISRSKVTITD